MRLTDGTILLPLAGVATVASAHIANVSAHAAALAVVAGLTPFVVAKWMTSTQRVRFAPRAIPAGGRRRRDGR